MEYSRYEPGLRRVLRALQPYLEEIVVIGGWVPYLYRRYGGFTDWSASTSLTAEVDVLLERHLPQRERPSIPELLRLADFWPSEGAGGLAVWKGDIQAGEKIEFLIPHHGTSRQMGTVVPVPDQAGMAAIPLVRLELMRQFKQRLAVPIATDRGEQFLEIWVPTLGAYTVNKASTFLARREHPGGGNPKRAKDLLYLRDLMAAGPEVVARIQSDLADMVRGRGAPPLKDGLDYARDTLKLALTADTRLLLPEVAAMLIEREPVLGREAALADVQGHLTDLMEVLSESSK